MLTRCPKCSTTFRISSSQLSAAGGSVRCGACLTVFQGNEQLIDDDDDAPLVSSTPVDADVTERGEMAQNDLELDQIAADLESEFDLDAFDDPTDDDPTLDADDLGLEELEIEELGAAEPEIEEPSTEEPDAKSDESIDNDDELIHDDMAIDDIEKPAEIDIEFKDDSFGRSFDNELINQDDGALGDESWAEELLAELEDESVIDPLADRPDLIDEYAPLASDEPAEPIQQTKSGANPQIIAPAARLGDFEEEPLELEKTNSTSQRATHLMLWIGACLTAVTALMIQIGVHKFDQLALDDQYRPYYAQACRVIGCQLPEQNNPSLIRVTNTYSRINSDKPDLLTIEVIIKNTASYKQPYPAIDLFFDATNGETVASRRLEPKEYLKGELAGARLMPANTPVRIAVDILDPGADAAFHKVLIAN